MVRAATRSDPHFEASDIEVRRVGPSYTVDTLRELREDHPEAEIFLVLGADQLRTFASEWKEPESIIAFATLAVMDRAGANGTLGGRADLKADRIIRVPVTRIDLSSTEIRDRVARGEDVSALVPDGVLQVIERERLYRA
jgi:nicotinate-nucleotide adenylyltransferase